MDTRALPPPKSVALINDYAPVVAAVTVADDGTTSTKLSRPDLHVRAELEIAPLDVGAHSVTDLSTTTAGNPPSGHRPILAILNP
jgi:hypothetical protein